MRSTTPAVGTRPVHLHGKDNLLAIVGGQKGAVDMGGDIYWGREW